MEAVSPALDDLDRKILEILREDARTSFAKIAGRLNTAESTVRFRVKRLMSKGIIVRFIPLLNPTKIGLYISGAVLLKIRPTRIEKVSEHLTSLRETSFVYQSTGEYDIVAVVYTRDMAHLNELVRKIKMISGVKDARVSVTTRFIKFEPTIEVP